MSEVKLYLFGSPHFEVEGQPVKLELRKSLALLAYLAIQKEPLQRDFIINLLWPDEGSSRGRSLLRHILSPLRIALPAGWLVTDRDTIGWQPDIALWVDVLEFRLLLKSCGHHGHPESEICPSCQPLLTKAAELYQDDFMAGFTLLDSANFDEWQYFQAEGLRQALDGALKKLVRCLVLADKLEQAIQPARRRLVLDPLNEDAHCDLMLLYAWTHQRNLALRQYRECKEVLNDQLGIDPQKTTLDLMHAIESGQTPSRPTHPAWQSELASDQPDATQVPKNNIPTQSTSVITHAKETGESVLMIQMLGSFSITMGQNTIPNAAWKSRRVRNLVKLLTLAPGHRLLRDQIIATLWPDSALTAAANNFHQTLFAARRLVDPIAPGCLLMKEGELSLTCDVEVDADAFEAAAARAKDSHDPATYQEALAVYSGDLLPDDLYEEWTLTRRESLRQGYLRLLFDLARLYETRLEYPQGIAALQRLLASDQSNEDAHSGLMRLYALSGQRQPALRQYQTLREVLKADLEVEPSPDTTRLYEDIQSGRYSAKVNPSVSGREILRLKELPSGTVTFLFTDIEGSTQLWEKMPEAMQASLAEHHSILRQAIETNDGQVCQVIGDSFQAAFRLATDGVRAALAAQRSLRSAQWGSTGPLRVRMGLHTGPAELDTKNDAPYQVGHTLNRTARLMAAGFGGQILLSKEAADLTARELPEGVTLTDLGEYHLKGMSIPEHIYQATGSGLREDFPALSTGITYPSNLPLQLTSFIGREKEITHVQELLHKHRLITLTGSGGVGKSRLSLQVAQESLKSFPDGAWLVELAPLSDPETLPQSVATVLGLQRISEISYPELLVKYLLDKHLLLILDNCEHLLEACSRLADYLLHGCPKLTLLATSREALGIAGEISYRVPSLTAPDPASISPDDLAQTEGVRLFSHRASAVLSGFQLSGKALTSAADLCHRLDGIPLAIELAAARINVLSVDQIATRLDDRFRLLTGGSRTALPRQRTLRASIDWSYNLLIEPERLLLQRLSVFSGGWVLEAAEKVCAIDGLQTSEILDGLASLVNKSLVVAEHTADSKTRYRMLETIRQFAQEKLNDTGQNAVFRDRHLDYYLALSEDYAPQLHTPGIVELLDGLDLDLDNLRGTISWALGKKSRQGVDKAVRIIYALQVFWLSRALTADITAWVTIALLQLTDNDLEVLDLRAKALFITGSQLTLYSFEQLYAKSCLEESVHLFRLVKNKIGEGLAAGALCWTLANITDPNRFETYGISLQVSQAYKKEAYQSKQEALALFKELLAEQNSVSQWVAADMLYRLGLASSEDPQPNIARTSLRKAMEIFNKLGDLLGELNALIGLAFVSATEESEIMLPYLEQRIQLADRLKSKWALITINNSCGDASYFLRRYQEMSHYFQVSRRLYQEIGNTWGEMWPSRMVAVGLYHSEALIQAMDGFQESLKMSVDYGDTGGIYACLIYLSGISAKIGSVQRAVKLQGFIERQIEDSYKGMDDRDKIVFDQVTIQIQEKLNGNDFVFFWQQGREMTLDQVLLEVKMIGP